MVTFLPLALVALLPSPVASPRSSPRLEPPARVAPTQTPETLDDDGLRQMLQGMGYEAKKLSKGFLISISREGWTYYVQLVLSSDGTKLGLNANVGMVPDPSTVPATAWRKLLEDNVNVDPSSFNYDGTAKKVYLHRVMDNRGLTPSLLKRQIENFVENIHDTSADWSAIVQ